MRLRLEVAIKSVIKALWPNSGAMAVWWAILIKYLFISRELTGPEDVFDDVSRYLDENMSLKRKQPIGIHPGGLARQPIVCQRKRFRGNRPGGNFGAGLPHRW